MATTTSPDPLLSPITRVAIVAVGAYVGAQVIADITSLKIGSFAGRAVDMGTFIYPITFTLRDVVHKALGRRAARTLVVTAAAGAASANRHTKVHSNDFIPDPPDVSIGQVR